MKYIVYCRKSSDSEDRQVLSLDSQEAELLRMAKELNLTVVKLLRESMSAKAPGRPLFNELVEMLSHGKADGILCWKLDRLARNPVDGGSISWLLQQGIIKHIKTAERDYYPHDNVLLMAVELGMANQYVRDLSANVKRGNRTKVENGWRPGAVPIGYLNDQATKTIVADPLRFPLIRRVFDFILTGAYTPRQLYIMARDEWGLRTPQKKRLGGKPVSLSGIYRILYNPFYAGIIEWEGGTYPGKHPPVVSIEEFDRVQAILGRSSQPRPKQKYFAFTGMIRCGECGRMVTAEEKYKKLAGGGTAEYTYYHCSKRLGEKRCSQRSIELRELERHILNFITEEIVIPDRVYDPIHEIATEYFTEDALARTAAVRAVERALSRVKDQNRELTGMRMRGMLSDEEFLREREVLQREELKLSQQLARRQEAGELIEPLEDYLMFRNRATIWFLDGEIDERRLILETVGSNRVLDSQMLLIEARKPFIPAPSSPALRSGLAFVRDVITILTRKNEETAQMLHNISVLKNRFGL